MIEVAIKFDERQLADLNQLPYLMQHKIADKCLSAMAKPVVAKAKMIAPSSRQSGTRRKWSKKYKNNAAYQNDSGKSIGATVFKGDKQTTVFIGGLYPLGNKLQFSFGHSKAGIATKRKQVFWGKRQGNTYTPENRFLDRAADETKTQQESEFVKALVKALQEI